MVIAGILPSISSFEIGTWQGNQASQAEDILGSEWVLWSDKKHMLLLFGLSSCHFLLMLSYTWGGDSPY